MKPRICFVIPSLGVGGTERQLLYLIEGLTDSFEILVICTREAGAWVDDLGDDVEMKVLGLGSAWDPRLKGRLRSAFADFQPNVAHSFMFGFDYAVNIAARSEHVPVVISSRRQLATWKKPRHIRLQKRANELVDTIVANSAAVAEYAAQQEGGVVDDYRVILNGIDVDGFQSSKDSAEMRSDYGIPEGKKIVGMVANFSPVKDHALFVEMAGLLAGKRSDVHFLLVGDGPLVGLIEEQLRESGLQEVVTRLSTTSKIQEFYTLMDVVVLTSKSEGFPNVVMEAMASGTPVVAANVGGIPELIEHGVTGTLIKSREPEEFADAVGCYLDDSEKALETARRGTAFVREELSLQRMIEQYRAIYGTLLTTQGGDKQHDVRDLRIP